MFCFHAAAFQVAGASLPCKKRNLLDWSKIYVGNVHMHAKYQPKLSPIALKQFHRGR